MPTVTSIEPQKKKPDRFSIFVDGKFAFGLGAETLVKSGLKVGQEVSEKEIEKLVFENETSRLLEKALRFLSFRPRSERELRDHLRKKVSGVSGMSIDTIDTAVKKLQHLGYVNDSEFARWWVEQRQTHKPRGAQLIRRELYKKGISREIIDQVLPESENQESEVERALAAAGKKIRSYRNLEPQKFRQKLGQYLARRGFGWETIADALDRLVDTFQEKY